MQQLSSAVFIQPVFTMSARLSDSAVGLDKEERREKQALVSDQLHEARTALKKKYDELRLARDSSMRSLEEQYLPITSTLKDLVTVMSDAKGETVVGKKKRRQRSSINSYSELENSKSPSLFYNEDDDEQNLDSPGTVIFAAKGEGPSQALTPPPSSPGPSFMSTPMAHPSSFLRAPQKSNLVQRMKRETKKLEAARQADADNNIESVRTLINTTPDGQKMTNEFVNRWPPFAAVYLKYLTSGKWEGKGDLDKYYGPTVNRHGTSLGASKMTFDENCIYIDGTPFEATPGLYELIFLKNPLKYDARDFDHYSQILKKSRVVHHGYDLYRPLNRFGGEKYKSIISVIFPPKSKKPQPAFKPSHEDKIGSGVANLFTHFQEFDEEESPNWILTEVDPNILVKRLELSLGSFDAGNSRLQSTANKIIDRLEELGYIY